MRILVTGGAGYVGSHVVQSLLESGHEPTVLDNLSTGHEEAVTNVEIVTGDIRDRELLRKTLGQNRFDGAVHLAAFSLVGESMRDPIRYFRNNVSHSLELFEGLIEGGVPWVVLSSSAAVYGNPLQTPLREDHPLAPTNPYGESKLILERILSWYATAYGFRSASLRYFNAAGAHPHVNIGEDHSPETHLIPILMQAALGVRDGVDVFGTDYETKDGTAIRDYVHVCDLARAHVRVMERLHSGDSGGVYNLGSRKGYSVLEIIDAVLRITGKSFVTRMSGRRPGDPPILIADASKAHSMLEWTPEFDLDGIVETAWRWHRNNPSGYSRS